MTINDYLNDKTTKSEREKLDHEYEKITKEFSHVIYRFRDYVIFHVIVPSTSTNDVNYDVILQIKLSSQHEGYGKIDQCETHVFSNCPSFTFKVAYELLNARLVPNFLLDKFSYTTLTTPPKVKHENYLEKSIYFAMKYVHENGLDNNSVYKTTGKSVNFLAQIASGVRSQQEILNKSRERIEQKRQEKKEKSPDDETNTRKSRVVIGDNSVKNVPRVGKTSRSKMIVKVKTNQSVKRTKRV